MSNFGFVATEWPDLHAEAVRAERFAFVDPRTSCFYARRALELTLTWLYTADSTLRLPYQDDLSAMIYEPTLRSLVGPALHAKMDLIRRQGNAAVHRAKPISTEQAVAVVRDLFHVLYWVARTYAREAGHAPSSAVAFDVGAIPRPGDVRAKSQAEIKELNDQLAARDEELAAVRARAETSEAVAAAREAEVADLQRQVAAAKARQAKVPDDHDYDEAATRDQFIDLLLSEAGWALDQARDREFEVTGMPNAQGKGFVDYVLWGDDGRPLAVVEAKRTKRDAVIGQQQAKLYADCLAATYGQRPVIFYTNGYEHWMWDDLAYPPRQVQGFYTKDELALLIARRSTRVALASTVVDEAIASRHYQQRAIRAVGEAFERDRQRGALLVMATGSGKTRTAIALVDQLMRANWAKRVLFLADRVALVNQAVGAFKAHLPDSSPVNLVTEKDTDGRVYVSTYPTMMGLINSGDGQRRFGPGFFDLVIIDEAHRSVYQKYRAIFTWFDSLLLGLTATPKDEVDRNTYSLFELEDGVPTDSYGLEEAVAEGYLVPPRAVSVPLKFQREGIRYHDLSEDERDEWDALDWGEDAPPDAVSAEALNAWLFNADTVDQVLKVLMTRGHRVAGGDRLGKTIIFAKNTDHAKFIAQRFDLAYPEYAGHFARIITYKTEYAQSLIDDFAAAEKAPHIAISVDMLDTGIDIPEVVNLVYFKLVRSVSKFWQMLGRGTRLRPDLFGPGQHKTDFFVFDFCGNLEFFNSDPAQVEGSLMRSLGERVFEARAELVAALDEAGPGAGGTGTDGEHALRDDVAGLLHRTVRGMNLDNFVVRPSRRWVEMYAEEAAWARLTRDQAAEATQHLAGLPSAERDEDEHAKRFDLLALRLQLGVLEGDAGVDRLRRQVQQIAAGLLEQTAIPAIAAEARLLAEVAGDEWWIDVTLPMLELMRRRLRGLVRLLERAKQVKVYTDFVDELGEISEMELRRASVAVDENRFRAKARDYLRAHLDHVALQKVRRNRQLTPNDLTELERMLLEAGIGEAEEVARASDESQGLGVFVRSLVGLERDAAAEAFSRFLDGSTHTRAQIDFVWTIVTHLTENGVMEPGRLYDPPFTDSAPQGPDGLFSGSDIEELVSVLSDIRRTAASAGGAA